MQGSACTGSSLRPATAVAEVEGLVGCSTRRAPSPAGEGWDGGEAMVVDKTRIPPHLNPLSEGEDLKTGHLFSRI